MSGEHFDRWRVMFGQDTRSRWSRIPLTVAALLIAVTLGCSEDPAAPTDPLHVEANITILNLHSTNPDLSSDATCQTGASVLLEASGSSDPAGRPIRFEWRDEVDYGDGSGLYPSADWGPESNILQTTEEQLGAQFYTIALHHVTLTVRTQDGRMASRTLLVRVTSCETCGTP